VLIIDESLAKRLATELTNRNREAVSVAKLGFRGTKDPELLAKIALRFRDQPWILVTGDDHLPADHAEAVLETAATIATVDPRRNPAYSTQESRKREVVHRWAHVMQLQTAATVRRYSVHGHRVWTNRYG
jgi:hypothetical protein